MSTWAAELVVGELVVLVELIDILFIHVLPI